MIMGYSVKILTSLGARLLCYYTLSMMPYDVVYSDPDMIDGLNRCHECKNGIKIGGLVH